MMVLKKRPASHTRKVNIEVRSIHRTVAARSRNELEALRSCISDISSVVL
jgi:hypothetical protein